MFNQLAAQLQTFTLAGAGVSQGDNLMTLTSFNSIAGIALTMAAFGLSGFMTVEPGSGMYEEQINFTGITPNMDGTVTLTGISNVSMLVDPSTHEVVLTPNFAMDHAGGVNVCVSNTSGWYGTFANRYNAETIHQPWTFNALAEGANPKIDSNSYSFQALDYITKGYADATYAPIGGGGSITLETNGTPNGSQTLLNLVAGSNTTLIDNGSGSVTIASTGGGGTITPTTTSNFFEEFVGGPISSDNIFGELGWKLDATSGISTSNDNDGYNHPGVFKITNTNTNRQGFHLGDGLGFGNNIQFPNLTIQACIQIPTTPPGNQEYFFGMATTIAAGTAFTSASFIKVGWIMPAGGSDWSGYAANGTTQNTVGSTSASFGAWVNLAIVFDSLGTTAEFFRDGVSEGTLSIPAISGTVNTAPWFQEGGASASNMWVDYFLYNQTLIR